MLSKDFREFVELLSENNVAYLVIERFAFGILILKLGLRK